MTTVALAGSPLDPRHQHQHQRHQQGLARQQEQLQARYLYLQSTNQFPPQQQQQQQLNWSTASPFPSLPRTPDSNLLGLSPASAPPTQTTFGKYPQRPSQARHSSISAGLNLSPRQMLAAQQHFGGAMGGQAQGQGQDQPQGQGADNRHADGMGSWATDDQDMLLQSLLGVGAAGQPGSVDLSGGNSSIAGSEEGASPSSFHDFIFSSQPFPTLLGSELGGDFGRLGNHPNSAAALNGGDMAVDGAAHGGLAGMVPSFLVDGNHGATNQGFDPTTMMNAQQLFHQSRPSFSVTSQEGAQSNAGFGASPLSMGSNNSHGGSPPQSGSFDPSLLGVSAPPGFGMPTAAEAAQFDFGAMNVTAQQQQQQQQQQHQQQQQQQQQQPRGRQSSAARKRRSPDASQQGPQTEGSPADAQTARLPKKMRSSAGMNQPQAKATPNSAQGTPHNTQSSTLPKMEVGSNATALAAIERIKANKQRADAALAELNRSPDQQTASLSSDSSSNGGAQSASALAKGQGADSLVPLTPAMKQQKKVAHNAIERRYRNNINDRIAQLRNAVPALRHLRPKKTASSRKSRKAGGPDELVDGVAAATKLNKATILGKATEYIKYLKGRELRLVAEVTGLRELVRSLEGGEELLELWEGEMERVVLEQEAAAAKEEEEQAAAEPLDDDDLNGVADGDDGDDDDEQEQSFESHQNGRWPTKQESPPATYGAGVRYPYSPSSDHSANGNGNAAGGAQRYLMAMFLGFTFLGSGAEIATDSAASDATSAIEPSSHGIVRAAGGRVIGAGHQLLKRAAASSLASPRVGAPQPHHLDHVPSHLLAFELLRAASFVACLAFVLWPLFARFTRRRDPAHVQARQAKTEEEHARRRKTTLAALARTQQEPENLDQALRAFVNAPGHWFTSALALVQQTAIMGAQNVLGRPLIKGPAPGSVARELEREKAAVWMRLLEVETALGARAQRSFIARVHTLLRVQNLRLDDQGPVDAITSPARVNATTALALNRLGATTPLAPLVNGLAQDFWARGRRALLLAAAEEEEDVEDADEDADFSPISDGTSSAWIHGSLRLSLDQACERTPTPQMVVEALSQPDTSARMCLSPLLGLADAQVTGALGLIWTRLFPALVDALCPSIDIAKSKALDLSSLNFDMDLVRDPSRRDGLSRECARLVRAAPSGTRSKVLAHTTLATWALMLGRTRLARTLATELATPNGSAMSAAAAHSASAFSLVRLVLGPAAANACLPVAVGEVGGRKPRAEDEVDALAATALGWLGFLRLFANSKSKTDEEKSSASSSTALVEAALSLRRLLAHPVPAIRHAYTSGHLNSVDLVARANADTGEGARIDSASESAAADAEMEAEAAETVLEEAKDRLTDVLALIGRRAARAAAGWKDEESDSDSGVDFASAT